MLRGVRAFPAVGSKEAYAALLPLTPALSERVLACALLHRLLRVPKALAGGGLAAVRDGLYGFGVPGGQ